MDPSLSGGRKGSDFSLEAKYEEEMRNVFQSMYGIMYLDSQNKLKDPILNVEILRNRMNSISGAFEMLELKSKSRSSREELDTLGKAFKRKFNGLYKNFLYQTHFKRQRATAPVPATTPAATVDTTPATVTAPTATVDTTPVPVTAPTVDPATTEPVTSFPADGKTEVFDYGATTPAPETPPKEEKKDDDEYTPGTFFMGGSRSNNYATAYTMMWGTAPLEAFSTP